MNAATTTSFAEIATASRRIARRALAMGQNRAELFMVEVQEARQQLVQTFLVALGMGICGLLAVVTLTAAVVVYFWDSHPVIALGTFTVLYGGAAVFLYTQLMRMSNEWEAFSATLDQLRKDHECLADKTQ